MGQFEFKKMGIYLIQVCVIIKALWGGRPRLRSPWLRLLQRDEGVPRGPGVRPTQDRLASIAGV